MAWNNSDLFPKWSRKKSYVDYRQTIDTSAKKAVKRKQLEHHKPIKFKKINTAEISHEKI